MPVRATAQQKSKATEPLNLEPNAEAVLRSRYLMKNDKGEFEETPAELFHRVADAVASAEKSYGLSDGAVETIRDEFYRIMTERMFLPNSPTLMNAGRSSGMLSACFVLPVEDSVDAIFAGVHHTALIQKAGGGTGFSFSRLRPKGDRVSSSGGTTSGPISFMKVFSEATNAIQQGAFRRGANMGIMRIDHPDVVSFIRAKEDLTKLTNFNLSVGLTDEFMNSVNTDPSIDHAVYNPRNAEKSVVTREDGSCWTVGEVFDLIVEKAWQSGEPGVIFLDRINEANPTPHAGPIEATNPCGEQPLLPFESCNLGSINLARFVNVDGDEAAFDFDACREVIHLAVRYLDDVIDINRYPIPEIADVSRANRKIGLGVMGFADALYALGIPYDSDKGLEFGETIMRFLNDESHKASERLAEERGTFPNWRGSTWEQRGIGMRNACTTTVAPTGTISIIAGCSGGIEPLFSLAFMRNVLNGQKLKEVNTEFARLARARGFYSEGLITRIAEKGSIRGMPEIPEDVQRVFVTAHDIDPEWHIRMQAAFQRHCDASISKTINFPQKATAEDVRKIYLLAYEHRCKGLTVYRDGCRENQPMALNKKKEAPPEPEEKEPAFVAPIDLPELMSAIRIKQRTPFGNMHIKIVVDPISGREREIFAQLGKGGDVACSDLEGMCRLISLYLRVNGSLDDVMTQLDGIGSSLSVSTKDGRITSLADGLAKAIRKYMFAKDIAGLDALLLGRADLSHVKKGLRTMSPGDHGASTGSPQVFKVKCPECTGTLAFEEGCVKCPSCGFSQC
ncbi:MAG: vitamin B12-dependent ribonucleotide reductase [Lentisphaerae bacterium]|nr:vitamin B12-dependent ribonucleotide reductase [Lentisphaerota bacterium]